MRYQYNYDFLAKWKEINPQISPNAIQNAIGSKSNNAFKAWLRKDGPMPIITILRFCNAFQVPISSFLIDSDAEDKALPTTPAPDIQLEPNGGYATLDGRQQGERSILNPLDVTITSSHIPDAQNNYIPRQRNKEQGPKEVIIGNISDANMTAIINLQHEQNEQKNKLLDIIAQQQKQIADLTKKIMMMQEKLSSDGYGYGMVAETEPHI